MRRKLYGVAMLAAGLAAPAASIVYDVPTDAELVAQSSLIVYGRVEHTTSAPDGAFTDATVRIERVLKGLVPGDTVVVRQQGGRGVVVVGLPMFLKGDRALLFLDAGQAGVHRTVGMGLGIFFENRGHLSRHDVPDDGFRHAERFGRWIEDREAGVARPADYRVEEIPGPRRVRQEANWLTVPEGDCWRDEAGAGKLMRWAQWDSGFSRIQAPGEACCDEAVLSTKVKVTSGGWTDQKALDMTNAAAALWNGDSGSNVNIPAAEIDTSHPWTRADVRMQAVIGVEYGASMGYTLGSARAKHTYNGDEMPLFLDKRTNAAGDEVAVVMFDEDGASSHASSNTYKCVKWGQRAGAAPGGNPGDALCSTHEGAYTPQGTVEAFMELVRVPRTGVRGYAVVHHECTLRFGDEYRTTRHSIPGGGGQAYRIAHATAFISEEAMGNANTILSAVAHEMGHTLGFDHPASGVQSIMGAIPVGGYTSLQADDRTAVRRLYPASGGGSPPSPVPEPEPPQSGCTLVAPYWSGPTGGFTVRPAPGRSSVNLTCGGRTTEYMAEDGIATRLVESSCGGTGLQLAGAAPGGWYWQHGDRNAAVAPLVCSEALGGPSAVVPGGVTTDVTEGGTLIRHDTARLVGIVPHLAGNECGEYLTPYWQGEGGLVVRPEEGRQTVRIRVQCGRTYSTMTPSAGEDGVIAELVRKSYCTDDESNPKQGRLTVKGAAPGGWYWIRGENNAAVAPLVCADLLGGPEAVDPGGVVSRATEDGTYFRHDVDSLIGVVPHVGRNAKDN